MVSAGVGRLIAKNELNVRRCNYQGDIIMVILGALFKEDCSTDYWKISRDLTTPSVLNSNSGVDSFLERMFNHLQVRPIA